MKPLQPLQPAETGSGRTASRQRLLTLMLLGALVIVLGTIAVGAEFAARYYERHRTTAPDYFPSILYPHRRLRYGLVPNLDYYGWFRINSLGFRGREFSNKKSPGVIRIVCLGGSTTFDIGSIGRNQPWPEILEASLRRLLATEAIEVLNLGIPGTTSIDSLIDLQMRALSLEPDLLIVYQAHNDFIYSIPPPTITPASGFPLEDAPRSSARRWMGINSLLYAKSEGRVSELFSRLFNLLPGPRPVQRVPSSREAAITQGVATFESNLRSLAAVASVNSLRVVLPQVVIPYQEPARAAERCRACDGLSAAYGGIGIELVRSTFAQYNAVLEQLGNEPGIQYVRTEDFVPSADRYYHDSVHFAPPGSALMGTKLAEAIAPALRQRMSETTAPDR